LDRVFCYGTLCVPEIMHRVAGRDIPAGPAVLDDYACYAVRNRHYPAAAPEPGSSITGLLYSGLPPAELVLLDSYETLEYRRLRVSVTTEAGRRAQAWVYVIRSQYSARLSAARWSLEEFFRTQAENYLRGLGAGGGFRRPPSSFPV
jgi:gamma-glutamylcyclotransferase (GGCT)/AIG2-like uncharacterized protein YtfP